MEKGIYQFVNLTNRKRYIGSSENIEYRRKDHVKRLRRGVHENGHLQAAWNQYGEDQFSFSILKECDPDDLLLWEQLYVDCYDPADLYNINLEVDRPPAKTEETRRKLSEAAKNRSEETRRKLSEARKGRVFTEETRRKMSEAHKGRTHTDETRRKMSEAAKNISEETRRKMSKARKGRPRTEETRRKISEAHKGKVVTEETRRKLSVAQKGKVLSDEARRKMSEAAKNRLRPDYVTY